MPKFQTLDIQRQLEELGTLLGFDSCTEESIYDNNAYYVPRYDCVWYLDLEKHFNLKPLRPLFAKDPLMYEKLKRLPFAGFEIEGASTSSKNQLGNFANLYSGNFIYKFVIVNNEESNGEGDVYRRGLKLHRYFNDYGGICHSFFFDNVHFQESIKSIRRKTLDKSISTMNGDDPSNVDRSKVGGEAKNNCMMFDEVIKFFCNTGFCIAQNYCPQTDKFRYEIMNDCSSGNKLASFYLRQSYYENPVKMDEKETNSRSAVYVPKLDLVIGIKAPKGFLEWLRAVGVQLKNEVVNFPIMYQLVKKNNFSIDIPLISLELENSQNKHANGGLFNMSKHSYLGIVVTQEDFDSHFKFITKHLGLNNILSYVTNN